MTKKEIRAEFCTFDDATPENFIFNIQQAVAEATVNGYKNLHVSIDSEQEPYSDYQYPKVALVGVRLETDEEYAKRIQEEELFREHRRRVYESMKKEFEQ